ncbi:MAG TPA: sugar nucleotide-binding protein, partial [Hymenobacter sp.]
PDLVNTALDLLLDEAAGVWHVANRGACTWAELAYAAVRKAGLPDACIVPRPLAELGLAAPRPRQSVLTSEKGMILPSLESALDRCVGEIERHFAASA